MKKNKRCLALILAAVMVLQPVTTAFADADVDFADEISIAPQETEDEEAEEPEQSSSVPEEADEPAEPIPLYINDVTEVQTPSVAGKPFKQSREVDGVVITVSAEAGAFPDGAELYAAKVTDEKALEEIEEVIEDERDEERNVSASFIFDIKILLDGEETEPDPEKGNVRVSFAFADAADGNSEAAVYHISEAAKEDTTNEAAEEIAEDTVETVEETAEETGTHAEKKTQLVKNSADEGEKESSLYAEALEISEESSVLTVETDSFSYYTIEFTYEEKKYVLGGDSAVKLSEIQNEAGLTGVVTEAISSDPELFSVVKDTEGSDWTVTALEAFGSEESLTLIIGGFEYVIKVTDEVPITETIYWGIKDGVLKISTKNQSAGSTYSGSFSGTSEDQSSRRPWMTHNKIITSVVVGDTDDIVVPKSLYEWFYSLREVESIALAGLNSSNAVSMDEMFYQCLKLKSINLSGLDTGSVTSMKGMFKFCSALEELDLSGFDTGKVTSMEGMFGYCSALKELDLSGFDTGEVISMQEMFRGCSTLNTLDLSGFDTSKLRSMAYMFGECENLACISLGSIDTSNVANMSGMLYRCQKITEFDLSKLKFPAAVNMDDMFAQSGIESVDLSNLGTVETSMSGMFSYCLSLKTVKFSNSSTVNVKYLSKMFNYCSALEELDLSSFNTSKVTSMEAMFAGCSKLTSLDLSNFNTSKVTSMDHMFSGCTNLESLDCSNFDTSLEAGRSYTIFSELHRLQTFKKGEKTKFYQLPTPSADYIFGTDGYWYDEAGKKYTASELVNAPAGTYSAVSPLCVPLYWGIKGSKLTISTVDQSTGSTYSGRYDCISAVPWLGYKDLVTSVVIGKRSEDVVKPSTTAFWFSGFSNLTEISLEGLDTSDTLSMKGMFIGCSTLTSIDLSGLNTSKVTSMQWMFSNCSCLKELDLRNFNTSEVTDMSSMFSGCSGLMKIDLSSFDTSKVTTFQWMFDNDKKLTKLDLSNFTTPNVQDFGEMFSGCEYLQSLDISGFDTSNIQGDTWLGGTFSDCNRLAEIKKGDKGVFTGGIYYYGFPTPKPQYISGADGFYYDETGAQYSPSDAAKIKKGGVYSAVNSFVYYWNIKHGVLTISNTDQSVGAEYSGKFYKYKPLTYTPWGAHTTEIKSVIVGNYPDDMITVYGSTTYWFTGLSAVTQISMKGMDTSNVTDMSNMFSSCSRLKSIDVSTLDTSNVTNMSAMFYACSGLTELDLSSFDTSGVTDMSQMFRDCSNLENLNLSSFDTSKVGSVARMFEMCQKLTSLDVSKFDTSAMTDMSYMFNRCSALESLDVSSFNTSEATSMEGLFKECSSLTSLDVTGFDTSNVVNMRIMFDGCSKLTELDLNNFKTSKVTTMANMFSSCTGLTDLDLSVFDTPDLINITSMFYGCENLNSLDLSNFNTTYVVFYDNAFENCYRLSKIKKGSNAKFQSGVIPSQSSKYIPGADGYWYDENHVKYTPDQMGQASGTFKAAELWKIIWKDENGKLIDTTLVLNGQVPTHATPKKESTVQYEYEFANWVPEVVEATADTEYQAKFTAILRDYTITWKDDTGKVIDTMQVIYGYTPTHAVPVKAPTEKYSYVFAGWSPEVTEVTGDATYQATFTETERKYTITWKNYDGAVLKTDGEATYGQTPIYDGKTPTRPETDYYTYQFNGWTPELSPVTADIEYTAKYQATPKTSDNVEQFVLRLYQVCLEREPDESGFNWWVSDLKNHHQTGIQAACNFLFSEEFKQKNYCNSCYIKHLYQAMMGREADEAGLTYWLTEMNNYATRERVFNLFADSKEFTDICSTYGIDKGKLIEEPAIGTKRAGTCTGCGAEDEVEAFVKRLYLLCLDRAADQGGLDYWCGRLRKEEVGGVATAQFFIFSDEFISHNYNNGDYVEHLYLAIMGRASDEGGKGYWVDLLTKGMSREAVFSCFGDSAEFREICKSYGIKN